jgi:hypothetical protein
MGAPLAARLAAEARQRRWAQIERAYQEREADRARVDVTAFWLGWADDGRGRVNYNGKEYRGEVLGATSVPGGTPVNLRRTPSGNFIAW